MHKFKKKKKKPQQNEPKTNKETKKSLKPPNKKQSACWKLGSKSCCYTGRLEIIVEPLTWVNRKSPEAQEETRMETRTTNAAFHISLKEYEKLHLEIK